MSTRNVTATVTEGNEVWKDVVGYEGYYQVSDKGRVKSLCRTVPMCNGRTYRVREKILKPAFDGHYYHVTLSKDGKEKLGLVHRLVLESFVGSCPVGMEARHFPDRDTSNNRLENLTWGTHTQNRRDRIVHGTDQLGKGSVGRIGPAGVTKLLKLWRSGNYSVPQLAKIFGVTVPGVCYHIKKYRIR